MKIAFIGLGNMGLPIARNLLKAGHELKVWNRTRSRAELLPEAQLVDTPANAARDAEVVFTMLADDQAVEAVVFGEDGFLNTLPKNAIHISSSTISVALSQRLNAVHAERGQRYLAAPVFGRPEAADQQKLFITVAGDAMAIKQCEPLLAAIGQRTFVMGAEPHLANVVKLTGNFMIITIIEMLGEAMALARKHGLNAANVMEFFTSSLFSAPVFKTYGGIIASERYEPAGFKLKLGLKDVRLALAAAENAQVPLPLASLIHDHALGGVARNMGDLDWSSLAQIAAENAGLSAK